MSTINISSHYGQLFDSFEAAQHAIECFPNHFPAGYCYSVETIKKSSDRGRTVMIMAAICIYDRNGSTFLGYAAHVG